MELYINDQKIDIKLEDEKNAGDILKALQKEAENNNATIVEININGENIAADAYEKISEKSIDELSEIRVQIVSSNEIDSSLLQISKELCDTGKTLTEIPVFLQTGKNKDADILIKNFADTFSSFCNIASLTALFPERYESFLIGDCNIMDFFKDFTPIVSDLAQAYESKDTVTVGDLCEYEISPRLLQISTSVEEFLKN